MEDKSATISFGVWASKEDLDRSPERVYFVSERARNLHLSSDFFSSAILNFSFYYPPLKGMPAKGKNGAFEGTESQGKEILEWILNMVARVERPDWDRKSILPSWGGAYFMTIVGPEVGAPNLIRLVFVWNSGIGGPQCAQFCKRMEEAYIAQDGYYD
jgi:hypothetical protein